MMRLRAVPDVSSRERRGTAPAECRMQGQRQTWRIGLLAGFVAVSALADPGGQDSERDRPWMGVFLADAVDGGVRLIAVVPGGPAWLADLRPGDILVQASESPLTRVRDLTRVLDGMRAGSPLQLEFLRSGEAVQRVLALAAQPSRTVLVAPPSPPAPPRGCQAYGLVLSEATPDLRRHYGAPGQVGVLVTGIDRRRPAADDGFRVGDLLVRLGDEPVRRVSDVERLLLARGARAEALQASLIRARAPAVLTLHAPRAPAADAVSREDPATDPDEVGNSRTQFERALRLQVEGLHARIEELKRELEVLQSNQPD